MKIPRISLPITTHKGKVITPITTIDVLAVQIAVTRVEITVLQVIIMAEIEKMKSRTLHFHLHDLRLEIDIHHRENVILHLDIITIDAIIIMGQINGIQFCW